jgi:hypothetical protein
LRGKCPNSRVLRFSRIGLPPCINIG